MVTSIKSVMPLQPTQMNSLPNMLDIHRFYDLMQEEHVILSYQGELNGELIDMLIQMTDHRLTFTGTRLRTKKKVINILVEALQNTYHYIVQASDTEPKESLILKSPFLILAEPSEYYAIFTGNYITNEQAKHLQERVRAVEGLSEKELQEYYVDSLNKKQEQLPQKGGAGLGLADIIRRAKHDVSFDFRPVDDIHTLFSLFIKVHKNEPSPQSVFSSLINPA